MPIQRWETPTSETVLTTGLDGLSAAGNAVSAAIAQTPISYLYADFILSIDLTELPALGGFVDLYILPTVAGIVTDGSLSVNAALTLRVGTLPVRQALPPQNLSLRGVILPPSEFRVLLRNETDIDFPDTGTVLKMARYSPVLSDV